MLLEDLQVVLKVAEIRSITGAATALDMRTATASAAVKRVEASLGEELFVRTTRQLRLSNAGERYLPQCEKALELLAQAKQSMRGDQQEIDGEVRISLSSDLGRNMVVPWLDEFLDAHPKVKLRTHLSDSNVDFYRDSVDMALRYGSPTDSNLYGFKICDVQKILCASPDYLAKHGEPQHPEDLKQHNGLFYQLHDVLKDEWEFLRDGQEFKVKMSGNRASNDADLVRRWCVAGKGIAIKSYLDMSSDLLAGNVVEVMADYQPTISELWLVCPSRRSITPTVRLLRDMFREKTEQIHQQLEQQGLISCRETRK
ncbi:Transcriptional regulator, LysR family protein [Vibrio sinaloensis DSM 21326]|uniref:Transcriptional regulator, LysR family protein n=1 Tax=Vibrio sinaloensis DSM 21326 TaxID=945550 RepID=E8M2T1_PHOS4|nr:LysR family transcriptional regulator [Vibrio sinaloensis]EGA71589.1 Transcriptional regulator, LysR family protein [Vibrio sinaloensis DSM 21326]